MNNLEQGQPKGWNQGQIAAWFKEQSATSVRSYDQDVVQRVTKLPANTNFVEDYGSVDIGGAAHPLLCVSKKIENEKAPWILITGGVHGYEPSGVEASLRFLEQGIPEVSDKFNFVVFPCISPWAYEYDHRWNADAEDPNRCFSRSVPFVPECRLFMDKLEGMGISFVAAIDLHETPDRDIDLRQQRASRFGSPLAADYKDIPQGFYLMQTDSGDTSDNAKQLAYGRAIINEVRTISPIAPESKILGHVNRAGILLAPPSEGLMRSYLSRHADLIAVTEVYPDHPGMGDAKAIDTQMASIRGALNHVLEV